MNQKLGDILEFGKFTPEQVDVTDINELSKYVPKDGHVDLGIAENLAVRFLRGADSCAELLGKLTWWLARQEDEKRAVLKEAMLVRATGAGYKTAKEKQIFAEADPEYLKACERASRAKVMVQWCKDKQRSLINAHYLMKHILGNNSLHRNASGMPIGAGQSAETKTSWGEKEW